MKSKTYRWMVIIVVLIGVPLAACGGEPPPPTPIPPTAIPPTLTPAATPTASPSEHVDLGMAYVEQGQLDEAVAEFEEAIRLDPDHAEAHFNLGVAYFQQGKLDEAVAELQTALELDPDDARAYRNLGTIYGQQDKVQEAAAAYEKALQLDPDYGEAHGDLGGIYTQLGRLSEAVAAAERAIELVPDYAMAYNNLGFAYYSQGRVEEAIAQYQEAIRIDPHLAKAHDNLGVAYIAQDQLDAAVAAFKEVIRINPDHVGGHVNLGFAYYSQEMYDEAIAEYQEAIRLNPNLALPHRNLALVYRDQGRTEEAVAEFETYLRLRPDAPDRTAVEKEIGKLEEPGMAEYRNAPGGYSLRYPAGWHHQQTGTQVELAETEEALRDAGQETVGVLFNAGPLARFAETVGIPSNTDDPVVVWQAMADRIDVEGYELQTFEVARFPAAASDVSGTEEGAPFKGALAVVLVDERLVYGFALAPPDQWETFRPTFVAMVNSLSFFPPNGEEDTTQGDYDTAFPLPADVQNFTGQGGESQVNFQTRLTMDEVIAFYRDVLIDMGLSEYELLTTIADEAFSLVFTGWPGEEEVVIQGVALGDNTNVNIRLEEVVES